MFKTILVPLDGSTLSESALPYAQLLARRSQATLVLVRAVHAPVAPFRDTANGAQAITTAEVYLETHQKHLATEGIQTEVGVPYGGSAATWITEEIPLRHVDLVVMATHHRTGPSHWLHGSVAETVVSRATVPVMVVQQGASEALAARLAEREPVLIVSLDGSERAEAALPVGRRLASLLDARVLLVGVVPKPGQMFAVEGGLTAADQAGVERLRSECAEYLASAARQLMPGAAAVECVVREGAPDEQIAEVAQERGAAAIIMSTHGRTGVLRSVLGSIAGGTLERTEVPLVLVGSHRLRTAEQPAQQVVGVATA